LIIAVVLILITVRIALPYIVKDYVNKTLSEIPDYKGVVEDIDMNLSVQWSALFEGSLVGEIILENPKINFVAGPTEEQSQSSVGLMFLMMREFRESGFILYMLIMF
jgi:hypothetical protein